MIRTGFEEVARRSRHLGFDGKSALHPDQIEACNRIYSPTEVEYKRAERILETPWCKPREDASEQSCSKGR